MTWLAWVIYIAFMALVAFVMGFTMPAGGAAYEALIKKIQEKKLRKKAKLQPQPA